jgi:hypothetical protein
LAFLKDGQDSPQRSLPRRLHLPLNSCDNPVASHAGATAYSIRTGGRAGLLQRLESKAGHARAARRRVGPPTCHAPPGVQIPSGLSAALKRVDLSHACLTDRHRRPDRCVPQRGGFARRRARDGSLQRWSARRAGLSMLGRSRRLLATDTRRRRSAGRRPTARSVRRRQRATWCSNCGVAGSGPRLC